MTKQWMIGAAAVAGLLFASACTTTKQSSVDRESGFLSDYSRLASEKENGGKSWANHAFELPDYDAILVPAVELWVTEEDEQRLKPENAERLSGIFRTKTIEKLQEHGWTVVDEPAPRVVTLRMALTELDGANPYGNFVTSIPYMTTAAIQLLSATADVNIFVGEVSTEVQLVDSVTGTILAEGIDRRVGKHSLANIGSTWGDVEDAMGVWADRIATGLSKLDE